jgi:tetratricopeptide (TPR) repeat protein
MRTSLSVLRGNLLFRSGDDALATYRYLQAKRSGGGRKWQDWIDYDLGTLYLSLGEIKPGVRVLNRTLKGFSELPGQPNRRDRELFFRGYFNLGVAHYESGNYQEAATSFIQALRLESDSWDAKINLELSIAALRREAAGVGAQAGSTEGQSEEKQLDKESEEILQSIHREERPAWVSTPAQETFEQDW